MSEVSKWNILQESSAGVALYLYAIRIVVGRSDCLWNLHYARTKSRIVVENLNVPCIRCT